MSRNFPNNDIVTKLMLNDIAKTSIISHEDVTKLFKQYHSIDDPTLKEKIKTKILTSNLRFVLKVAIYYNKITGVDLNDLMTEGKIGLFNAFTKFDYTKNIKFISLAVWDIRCMISKYLEENDLVRVPAHLKLKLNKAKKNRYNGNIEDIDFNMEYLLEQNSTPISLDNKIGDGDDDLTLSDILEDENSENQEKQYYKNYINIELRNVINNILTYEEKIIIENMFGLNHHKYNVIEVEELIGKSKERIRQIRDRALGKMKKHIDINNLHTLMVTKS
jgi:RNA polymerase primary sigma factor